MIWSVILNSYLSDLDLRRRLNEQHESFCDHMEKQLRASGRGTEIPEALERLNEIHDNSMRQAFARPAHRSRDECDPTMPFVGGMIFASLF